MCVYQMGNSQLFMIDFANATPFTATKCAPVYNSITISLEGPQKILGIAEPESWREQLRRWFL
jgi:hypothetical protein